MDYSNPMIPLAILEHIFDNGESALSYGCRKIRRQALEKHFGGHPTISLSADILGMYTEELHRAGYVQIHQEDDRKKVDGRIFPLREEFCYLTGKAVEIVGKKKANNVPAARVRGHQ